MHTTSYSRSAYRAAELTARSWATDVAMSSYAATLLADLLDAAHAEALEVNDSLQNTTNYSVCVDCFLVAAGYSAEDMGFTHLTPYYPTAGRLVACCSDDSDDSHPEYHAVFSVSRCDGCGGHYAGSRHHVVHTA